MTSVLIVDDSAVDRKLISSLIASKTDWQVATAENGVKALGYVETFQPDLVISDMRMPKMDGFQLVTKMREMHPVIPVIIITAQGSEEMAMEALRMGAASYCPKSRFSRDLISIANGVLSVSLKRRQSQQVLSRITESCMSFCLENNSALIAPIIEHLQSHMIGWDETDRLRVGVALDESLLNAMHHGNLEVDSKLRDVGDGSGYRKEIDKRRHVEPFSRRRVRLRAEITSTKIEVSVNDEGPGFCPDDVPDPTLAENLDRPSGRGLLLIRTFMNEVSYNDKGNQVTMIKTRQSDDVS